jgi:hypothetical protein
MDEALIDSVVGEYEYKFMEGYTHKYILLENGVFESHFDGYELFEEETKWTISNNEIHIANPFRPPNVYRINTDKSITRIASIEDEERVGAPKYLQTTFKKIK